MTRTDLLQQIATTIADYREGEIPRPSTLHVDQWVSQFDVPTQLPILQEMNHVLKQTYYSRNRTADFMTMLYQTEKLAGDNPCAFWKGIKFLNIQNHGESQRVILSFFGEVLKRECGYTVNDCGVNPEAFVYLDDAMFSGGHVYRDLTNWISSDAPANAKIHVVVIVRHQGADFNIRRLINEATKSGKHVNIVWWNAVMLEDREECVGSSDVLRPTWIPAVPEVQAYSAGLSHPPKLRAPDQVSKLGLFSNDNRRQILEQEFLKAGVRIRNMCPNLNEYQRPLGNKVLNTLGFGSLIVTFRNCANNTPLALWAGAPWHPLFPRKTNSQTSEELAGGAGKG